MTRLNFDRIAKPYRWLEYLSLGRALEHCRFHFLPQTHACRHALVLGDGDGRFTAKLLETNRAVQVDVVDISQKMLMLLLRRSGASARRIRTYHDDALKFSYTSTGRHYDLVVTHFFLDCLTQDEVDRLITRIQPSLANDALWVISDFRIPGGLMRFPAQAYVGSLYLVFRWLTGLRVTRLPDYATALIGHGLRREAYNHSLAGLLTSEVWSWHD